MGKITRRGLIVSASAALAIPALPGRVAAGRSRLDSIMGSVEPRLVMWSPHTKEKIDTVFYRRGRYDRKALAAIDHFLRDWRENDAREIDRTLYWGLAAIRTSAIKDGRSGEIHALCGYRSPKTNAWLARRSNGVARKSEHLRARAVDLAMTDCPPETIARMVKWLGIGGTGLYAGRFVHMDSGPVRSWGI